MFPCARFSLFLSFSLSLSLSFSFSLSLFLSHSLYPTPLSLSYPSISLNPFPIGLVRNRPLTQLLYWFALFYSINRVGAKLTQSYFLSLSFLEVRQKRAHFCRSRWFLFSLIDPAKVRVWDWQFIWNSDFTLWMAKDMKENLWEDKDEIGFFFPSSVQKWEFTERG